MIPSISQMRVLYEISKCEMKTKNVLQIIGLLGCRKLEPAKPCSIRRFYLCSARTATKKHSQTNTYPIQTEETKKESVMHGGENSSRSSKSYSSLAAELMAKNQLQQLELTNSNTASVESNSEDKSIDSLSFDALLEKYKNLKEPLVLDTSRKEVQAEQSQFLSVSRDGVNERPTAAEVDFYVEELDLEDLEDQMKTVKRQKQKGIRSIYGTPDPDVPMSDVPCSGCGAKLHCQNTAIPGYVPKEKFSMSDTKDLKDLICQKCYLMTYKNFCLNVKADERDYPQLISQIKKQRGLVILVVDLLDISNSFIQNLPQIVGEKRKFFIVGNKADLLPKESRGYLHHCKSVLYDWCYESGLASENIGHVCVVSAKTGYGIEELINKLFKDFDHSKKGDVFLLGTTNSGKSTLFNALLSSDYCKYHVRDVIHRATVSRWPGTTIDLLKFPIISPTPERMYRRTQRLIKVNMEMSRKNAEKKRLGFRQMASEDNDLLSAPIGQTDFRPESMKASDDQTKLSHLDLIVPPTYSVAADEITVGSRSRKEMYVETRAEKRERDQKWKELRRLEDGSSWLYDTPGLVNTNQVINVLSPEELSVILPTSPISPRTFVLKPSQVMLLSSLARIDYTRGDRSIYFTVIACNKVPVHVLEAGAVDDFYESHAGSKMLGVPLGGRERLMSLPSLIGRECQVTGRGWKECSLDVVLSSIGFVSVTAGVGMDVTLTAYTPAGRGCHVRCQPLLPRVVSLRGQRIKGTARYRVRTKQPRF